MLKNRSKRTKGFIAVAMVISMLSGCGERNNPAEIADISFVSTDSTEETTEKISIDPNDFCSVYFTGYESHGKAYLDINSDTFGYLLDDYDLTNTEKTRAKNIVDNMTFNASSETLKNGDNVKVQLKYDKDALNTLNINFSTDTITASASGLSPLTAIDPRNELQYYLSGNSGATTAELTYDDSQYSYLFDRYVTVYLDTRYCMHSNGYLANDDVVAVSFEVDKKSLWDMGYDFIDDELTFTISERTVELNNIDEFEKYKYYVRSAVDSEFDRMNRGFGGYNDCTRELLGFIFLPNTNSPNSSYSNSCVVGLYKLTDSNGREILFSVLLDHLSIDFANGPKYMSQSQLDPRTVFPRGIDDYSAESFEKRKEEWLEFCGNQSVFIEPY